MPNQVTRVGMRVAGVATPRWMGTDRCAPKRRRKEEGGKARVCMYIDNEPAVVARPPSGNQQGKALCRPSNPEGKR